MLRIEMRNPQHTLSGTVLAGLRRMDWDFDQRIHETIVAEKIELVSFSPTV